ncbi:acylphosphatase [Bifidobacterium sp. ESL0764]|uniref:acylphosphatase n=1 Tax=Bifidobacterium sp. ESL0764 TaxID=2983228 RepID=UPI0023F76AA9|nr:acylphosphatase [Bifidobacterium sp. ESL0764]WEV65655.1 acylphosphatase [Bifidobacterium sp. ESL0764]
MREQAKIKGPSGRNKARSNGRVIRVRAVVSGLVQGVGYRYFAVNEARRCDVAGWVRNRLDGSVEAEAQGEQSLVAAFVERLGHGPQWGRVDHVETTEIPLADNEGFEFRVRRDAR